MADARVPILLEPATHRLVRAVDSLEDDQWSEPSLLPGWTRAHLVAHLSLNAESLAVVLQDVLAGRPAAMYPSQQARDDAIASLSTCAHSEIRDRFLASTTVLNRELVDLTGDPGDLRDQPDLRDMRFSRLPDTPAVLRVGDVAGMRLREIEIHHADLGVGYAATDWPGDFAALLLQARSDAWPADGPGFTAYADDLDQRWEFGYPVPEGPAHPTVSGAATALAWWVSGRGPGPGLESNDGDLPQIGAW